MTNIVSHIELWETTFFLKFRRMKGSNFEYGFSAAIAKYVTLKVLNSFERIFMLT